MTKLAAQEKRRFFDPIHGFIDFDPIESALIESPYFERLRSIHQLGLAFWVYPGGRASRFEHSCGVAEIATQIFDRILSSPYSIDSGLDAEEIAGWRRTLRLAALVHDLGHLPFSHHAEKALLGERGHEWITAQIIDEMAGFFEAADLPGSVLKIALGESKMHQMGMEEVFTPWESLLSSIITSDACGADRIDYLLRDAHTTGLVHGHFDHMQLIDKLCIVDDGGLKIGIYASGLESMESLLVARYFMHKRLYYHPQIRALAMHASHIMKEYFPKAANLEHFLDYSDLEILSFIRGKEGDSVHLSALRSQSKRFIALEIEPIGSQSDIIDELSAIPLIDAEYSTHRQAVKAMDFPVLLESGEVVSSNRLSPLLGKDMLCGARYWIFAHPKIVPELYSLSPVSFRWKKLGESSL